MSWKCDKCGREFETKQEAIMHERNCEIGIKEHLIEGEKIIKTFGMAPKLIKFFMFCGIPFDIIGGLLILVALVKRTGVIAGIGIAIILIGLMPNLIGLYLKHTIKYTLTNKRVISQTGLITKKIISVNYDKITDVSASQNLLGKAFYDCGTIFVNTAGTPFHEIMLSDIERPMEIKKEIETRLAGR